MNVTFHAIGSFATAAVLSRKLAGNSWDMPKLTIGFAVGVLIHGVLDFLPHEYPLHSAFDVIFALMLLALMLFLAQNQNRLLILVCFAGAIFPDVLDLGPTIINKYWGITVPQLPFRVFPWHLKQYSGSIYDGSRRIESTIYHLLLLLICLPLIYVNRKTFFRF
jgi:hypothetical protein